MLTKSIQFYLHSDSAEQQKIETAISEQIALRYQKNLAALHQVMPNLYSRMQGYKPQQYAVFCDALQQLNAVDISTGQVFYSQSAEIESRQEVLAFLKNTPSVFLSTEQTDDNQLASNYADVVVMFGLGLGYQLEALLENTQISHLIIYEPSADLLNAALHTADWQKIFALAERKNTALYIQLDSDASSLPEDLAELSQHYSFEQFFLYRHYSHDVMDRVWAYTLQHSGNRKALLNEKNLFTAFDSQYDLVSPRHGNVLGNKAALVVKEHNTLYRNNLAALEKHYPEVAQVLKLHSPKHWQLVSSGEQLNLQHLERKVFFYDDLEQDSVKLIEHFEAQPFRDDVLVGHRPSYKLRSYLHNRQVTKILPILEQSLQQSYQLEETIDSLIIFGVGLGKHIEILLKKHTVKHLYICEPNLDFFLASLYVTDWATIFSTAEQEDRHIYLNLGGDGSQYFYDLMSQFNMVGAFAIANTYMLSSYFNLRMQDAISELKENLKVILAISEHYDNVRYGIAHTYSVLKQQAHLLKQASDRLPLTQQLPVFIVGNGPSLDQSFDYLHEYKDRAIIISCGTALKALYQQGICPDFHAEVEQNRATYSWVTKVNDFEYLKKIRLLTVNGIHPDTAALFKQTYMTFKGGEASTSLFINVLAKLNIFFQTLSFAYPTVSNMALSMALAWKAKSIYLFGVDLGFADIKYHHSKHSAYYKQDGSELYNYQAIHGAGIPIKGNFLPSVFTKMEFSVARKVMQESIKYLAKGIEVYNCSNGALINGATPLQPDNILIQQLTTSKEVLLNQFLEQAYVQIDSRINDIVISQLNFSHLEKSLDLWIALIDNQGWINEKQHAKAFIRKQWQFLRDTLPEFGNPTFLLLNGSTTYFSSIMLKLITRDNVGGKSNFEQFNTVLQVWREYLSLVKQEYIGHAFESDKVGL